jgi:N-acetylglutamate synthase-like GNAT family acetyltransferase
MTEPQNNGVVYRTFRPGDEAAFFRLNEAWITQDFVLEPADAEIIRDPKTHILDGGGQICIAEMDGEAIGCCALVVIEPGDLELAKMTVAQKSRGGGVGRKLLEFTIAEARRMGARRLYLESNKKAVSAVHLYEDLGFQHLPAPAHESKYTRANVFMEMLLRS